MLQRTDGCWRVLLMPLPSAFFPLQVAIIAGNFELAEIIKTHKECDVGELEPLLPSCLPGLLEGGRGLEH